MNTAREGMQTILRKHREDLGQAMQALQDDLRAHVETLEHEGSEALYDTNALGIYNEAYDLRLQVNSFFETWTD